MTNKKTGAKMPLNLGRCYLLSTSKTVLTVVATTITTSTIFDKVLIINTFIGFDNLGQMPTKQDA